MQSGMGRPDWDPEDIGDAVERQIQVVVKYHDRAVVDGQPSEAVLELVTVDDRAQVGVGSLLIDRQEPEIRNPASLFTTLGVAGTNEEPV
jgi:hypothetical protein